MNNSHRDTENTKLAELNKISEKIIGCAIEVHKQLGPGLLESLYESALCIEFGLNNINYQRQIIIPIKYKNRSIGEHRLDLLVENKIIIEIKTAATIVTPFEAQLLSYL